MCAGSVPLPAGKQKPRGNTAESVSDAIRHDPHTCSLSRNCSDKPGGYAPGIDAALEGYGKWSDVRRLWNLRKFSL